MSKVYDLVTRMIMEKLEEGTIPWQKPWRSVEPPMNCVTKNPYRGVNILLLGMAGFSSPWWLSRKQAMKLGGSIKSGEKYTPCIFWKILEAKDLNEGEKKIKKVPLLRFYQVFNVDQCDGIDSPEHEEDLCFDPIQQCDEIVEGYPDPPVIEWEKPKACYYPALDKINMPPRKLFSNVPEYYATLFHEMTHSTGNESRLNRKTVTDAQPFGTPDYSKEELIAEIGAAFLCGHASIENTTIDNSAGYIAGWLSALENDRRLVVDAAAAAQKAVDHILGKKPVVFEGATSMSNTRA